MCEGLEGYIFADRGYISKDKESILAKQGLKLVTTLKKNMKKVFRTKTEKSLLRNRGMIETMIDYLKNSLMLLPILWLVCLLGLLLLLKLLGREEFQWTK